MRLLVSASIQITATPETVFDLVSDSRNLAQFFRAWGPIPGAERLELLPCAEGGLEQRYVYMSNASRIEEQVMVLDRPRLYRYRWLSPPKPPLHLMVRTAQTDWSCEPAGTGTRLRWIYTFELTSRFAYPPAFLFSKLFKRWMVQALQRIRDAAHAQPAAAATQPS